MKNEYTNTVLAALTLVGGATIASADPVESFLDDSKKSLEEAVPGKFSVNARLRYEEFETPTNDRDGTSIRVRYGYTTPDFNGLSAMVEGETLSRVGGDVNDIHPLDELGDGTDLNQAWVQYKDADYGSIKVGRQIYALDDHRFIGHVGWRQNIQTFDAATFDYTNIEKLSVKGFYLAEQHSVFGAHNELDAYGANVTYAFGKGFKLTGFYYDIEGDDTGNANASNETIGLRATGAFTFSGQDFNYAASIAEQEDTGPSTADYDAGYIAGDLSTKIGDVTVGGGFEIFEPGFRTPLATVHKFNGFADSMLTLSGYDNGLEDFYVYAGYKIPVGNGIAFKAIYHWFDSETSVAGQDGGEEIDLVASYKINKYLSLVSKYGDYDSDGGVGNRGGVDKKMFTFELNFVY